MLAVLLVLLLALGALALFLLLKLGDIRELHAHAKRLQFEGAEACEPCKVKDEQVAAMQERIQKERRRHKAVEDQWKVPLAGYALAKEATELLRYGPLRINTTPESPIYTWGQCEQGVRRIEQELDVEA